MRIVYFYQYFGTPQGGWSTRAYEMARRWVSAGDSVTVITSVYDKSDLRTNRMISRINIEGIDVRLLNIRISNTHGFVRRVASFMSYALFSSWYAVIQPADVVIASSGPITVALPGLIARWIRRRPMVLEVRDLWLECAVQLGVLKNPVVVWLFRKFEGLCYRSAAMVVALSPGSAAWIRQRHPGTRIEVISNACDNELFRRGGEKKHALGDCSDEKLVVYAGSLGLMDDCGQIVDMAVELQRLNRCDIEVVVIGDGLERPTLEARVHAGGLRQVRFLGLLPKRRVVPWLQKASCALCTYKNVPMLDNVSPNKLFDALAAGVPVVQTTQGWIKTLLEQEQCGMTVPGRDPVAFARAVIRLTDDRQYREVLGENARRVADSLFDRDKLARRMRTALLSTIGRREARSRDQSDRRS